MGTRFPEGPELYCITDSRLSPLSHREQCRRMLAGGARLVQFRDKVLPPAARLAEAQAMRALCTEAGAFFVVNDDVELALAAQADALHLGQEDLSPAEARRRVGDALRIGLSTHNGAQLQAALAEPVDQISVGPIFGTTTKANPDPATGTGLLAEAAALAGERPVAAIGGIHAGNLDLVLAAAPRALVAVIGAVVGAPDITEAVRDLRRRLRR